MTRDTEVKAEENFPITMCGYTKRKLIDGTECDILVDTGTSKSYMSKSYFMKCKSLHSLPKFTSTTTRIQVGNRQYVGILFIIPVIMTTQNHRFVSVKPKEQRIMVLEAPFMEEISGMVITKMLDAKEQKTLTMKLKFIRNRAIFKVTKNTHETMTFDPKEMLGIVDIRSLGYYKIKQGALQQNYSCMYHLNQ